MEEMFSWMASCVCVAYLGNTWYQGEEQAVRGNVMLWTMFCWETLGPAIHVDVISMYHLPKHFCRQSPFHVQGVT